MQLYLYGFHAVTAFLEKHPELVVRLYADVQRKDKRFDDVRQMAQGLGLAIEKQTREGLDKLAATEHHQGIVAAIKSLPKYTEADLMDMVETAEGPLLLLILDGIQDPHNLGACLRTANAMGVNAVIAPKDRAVGLTSTVMKVASGAAVVTPFITVTNLARAMKSLQEQNVWFVGTDAEAESSLSEIDMTGSVGIVMGNEGQGMRRLVRESCDYLASIPMSGSVSSLNVSVATGMALYEAVRQRREKP